MAFDLKVNISMRYIIVITIFISLIFLSSFFIYDVIAILMTSQVASEVALHLKVKLMHGTLFAESFMLLVESAHFGLFLRLSQKLGFTVLDCALF